MPETVIPTGDRDRKKGRDENGEPAKDRHDGMQEPYKGLEETHRITNAEVLLFKYLASGHIRAFVFNLYDRNAVLCYAVLMQGVGPVVLDAWPAWNPRVFFEISIAGRSPLVR